MLGQSIIFKPSQSNSPIVSYLSDSYVGSLLYLYPQQLAPNIKVFNPGMALSFNVLRLLIPLKLMLGIL